MRYRTEEGTSDNKQHPLPSRNTGGRERGGVLREKTNQGSEETGGEQHKKRLLKKLQFKVLRCISDKTIYLTLLHPACLAES